MAMASSPDMAVTTLVSLLLQKEDVRLQGIDLVVNP